MFYREAAKKIISAIFVSLFLTALPASAQSTGSCADLEKQFDQLAPGSQQAQELLKKFPRHCTATGAASRAITIALAFAAAIAVVAIIYGGFLMITSAGNEEQFGKGRKTLTAAIMGLIVIVLAGLIVNIVANLITKGTAI